MNNKEHQELMNQIQKNYEEGTTDVQHSIAQMLGLISYQLQEIINKR